MQQQIFVNDCYNYNLPHICNNELFIYFLKYCLGAVYRVSLYNCYL